MFETYVLLLRMLSLLKSLQNQKELYKCVTQTLFAVFLPTHSSSITCRVLLFSLNVIAALSPKEKELFVKSERQWCPAKCLEAVFNLIN